jgi:hypothetical protein
MYKTKFLPGVADNLAFREIFQGLQNNLTTGGPSDTAHAAAVSAALRAPPEAGEWRKTQETNV